MDEARAKDQILIDLNNSPRGVQYCKYRHGADNTEYLQFDTLGEQIEKDGFVTRKVEKHNDGANSYLTITSAGRIFLAEGGYASRKRKDRFISIGLFFSKSSNWIFTAVSAISAAWALFLNSEMSELKALVKKQEVQIDSLQRRTIVSHPKSISIAPKHMPVKPQ